MNSRLWSHVLLVSQLHQNIGHYVLYDLQLPEFSMASPKRVHCHSLTSRLQNHWCWWLDANLKERALLSPDWVNLVKITPRYHCIMKIQVQQGMPEHQTTENLSDKEELNPAVVKHAFLSSLNSLSPKSWSVLIASTLICLDSASVVSPTPKSPAVARHWVKTKTWFRWKRDKVQCHQHTDNSLQISWHSHSVTWDTHWTGGETRSNPGGLYRKGCMGMTSTDSSPLSETSLLGKN